MPRLSIGQPRTQRLSSREQPHDDFLELEIRHPSAVLRPEERNGKAVRHLVQRLGFRVCEGG